MNLFPKIHITSILYMIFNSLFVKSVWWKNKSNEYIYIYKFEVKFFIKKTLIIFDYLQNYSITSLTRNLMIKNVYLFKKLYDICLNEIFYQ